MRMRVRPFGGAVILVAALMVVSLVAVGPWGDKANADVIGDGASSQSGLAATGAMSAITQQDEGVQVPTCTSDHVVAIVASFTEAVNGGGDATADAAEIAEFFPVRSYEGVPSGPSQVMDPEEFRGFGWNEFVSGDPQEVAAYFSQQFSESGLRLGIMRINPTPEISLQGYPEDVATFAISFLVETDADVMELNGRGAVNCVEDTILSIQAGSLRGD